MSDTALKVLRASAVDAVVSADDAQMHSIWRVICYMIDVADVCLETSLDVCIQYRPSALPLPEARQLYVVAARFTPRPNSAIPLLSQEPLIHSFGLMSAPALIRLLNDTARVTRAGLVIFTSEAI